MLVIPKYRTTLNSQEALKQTYENTDNKLAKYRLHDHDDLKNHEFKQGQCMHSSELVFKLRKLNPNIWVEETNSVRFGSVLNFYMHLSPSELADEASKPELYRVTKKCLGCAFPNQVYLPEFESINVDAADLATSGNRGWRTILLRLLTQGIITWKQVKSTFGDAIGLNSTRWNKETAPFRV